MRAPRALYELVQSQGEREERRVPVSKGGWGSGWKECGIVAHAHSARRATGYPFSRPPPRERGVRREARGACLASLQLLVQSFLVCEDDGSSHCFFLLSACQAVGWHPLLASVSLQCDCATALAQWAQFFPQSVGPALM